MKTTANDAMTILENCLESYHREHTGGKKVCDGMSECGECFLCEEYKPVPNAIKALRKILQKEMHP
jgi:hypothetical protein